MDGLHHPCVRATNTALSRMSEDVYAAPADGSWFFWWSWAERIGPIDDVTKAADAITYVLNPHMSGPASA